MTQILPLLALDTSGPFLQLGIAQMIHAGEEQSIEKIVRSLDMPKGHAEHLFAEIEHLLAEAKLDQSQLRAIATMIGPGSFTGLRIGISAARGLGLALNIPAFGVPNLLALSLQRPKSLTDAQPFEIFVDARRDQIYAQEFSQPGKPIAPPRMIAASDEQTLSDPKINMETMLDHVMALGTNNLPPDPLYVRPADAKPQTKNLIARQTPQRAL